MARNVQDTAEGQSGGAASAPHWLRHARGLLRYSFAFFFVKGMLWLALLVLPFVR